MRQNLKRLTKITAGYGLVQWAGPFLSLLFTPLITRALDESAYGVAGVFSTIFSAVTIVGMLGLRDGLYTIYNDHPEDEQWKSHVVGSALIVAVVSSALLGTALAILGQFFLPVSFQQYRYLLAVGGILTIFNVCAPLLSAIAQAGLHVRWGIVLSVITIVCTVVGNVLLVLVFRFGASGLVLTPLLTNLVLTISALYMMRHIIGIPKWSIITVLIGTGLVVLPGSSASWILSVLDRLILAYSLPSSALGELGYYEMANRLTALLSILVIPLISAWQPLALAIQHEASAKEQFSDVSRYLTAILLAGGLALGLYAVDILLILTPRNYLPAAQYVGFLTYMIVFSGFSSILSTAALVGKQVSTMTWAVVIGAIINIILNIVLIPPYRLWGATFATVIGYAVMVVFLYIVLQRRYPLSYPLKPICAALALQIILMFVGWLLPPLPWILRLGVKAALLLCLGISFIGVGLVTRNELQQGWQVIHKRWQTFTIGS